MSLLEKVQKIDLFRPEFLLAAYLVYLLVALSATKLGFASFKMSGLSFLIPVFSFAPFLIGIWLGKRCFRKPIPSAILAGFLLAAVGFYSLVFSGVFKTNIWLSLVFATGVLAFLIFVLQRGKQALLSWKASAGLCFGGILSLLVAFWQVGMPLFDLSLRWQLNHNLFFGISVLAFLVGYFFLMQTLKERPFLLTLLLSVAFFALTTMRWVILLVLLTGTFIAYYRGLFDFKKIFAAMAAAFLLILLLGSFVHQTAPPIELFFKRTAETQFVFSEIVEKSYPLGLTKGTLFFNGHPRDFVGPEIFGREANLTYTLLGAAMLDFGLLGVFVWMLGLGGLLQLAYAGMRESRLAKYYPLLLAISLVWLEIGPDQFTMLFFALFALAYLVKFHKP